MTTKTKTTGAKKSSTPRTARKSKAIAHGPPPVETPPELTPTTPTVPAATAHPFGPATGEVKLLGEIVTWGCTGTTRYVDLVAALKANDLDEKVAREMAPRHAFTRACKKLSDARIIRQTDDDGDTITFQFTRESKVDDVWEYAYETKLMLDKKTGEVTCAIDTLRDTAQTHLNECIAVRTASDVTDVIQKLFERNADLFRIRDQGGCYFVPAKFGEFLTKIDSFVRGINGHLRRYPVPAGTVQGNKSVRDTVSDGLADMIAEHVAAVDAFGFDTRDSTFERAAERIRETRFKIEAYADYLGDQKEKLEESLAEATVALKKRVTEIATAESVYLAESDDAWGKGDTREEAVKVMRENGEYAESKDVAYKLWKCHPATTLNAKGKFTCPVGGAPAPELVEEVTTEDDRADRTEAKDEPPAVEPAPTEEKAEPAGLWS